MPIYEFYSPDTHKIYSFFARSLAQGKAIPRCPDDPEARMERMLSRFAVTGRTKEHAEGTADLDPRMEGVMHEMEREMSSFSEDNPDPRQLGRIMRRMTEATGKKMPDAMRQMVERLEKGEDPEKLEKEYGDIFEGFDLESKERGTSRAHRSVPLRDPQLYEMRDYLDRGA